MDAKERLRATTLSWRPSLAILAVEQVPHRPSSSLIRFLQTLAFVRVHTVGRFGHRRLGFAARRAAVRKARLTWPQLELFRAHDTDSYRKRHRVIMIQPPSFDTKTTRFPRKEPLGYVPDGR